LLGDNTSHRYFFTIADVAAFTEPQRIVSTATNQNTVKNKCYEITQDCSNVFILAATTASSCMQKWQAWAAAGHFDASAPFPCVVLQIAYPVSVLVAHASWHHVALDSKRTWDPNCVAVHRIFSTIHASVRPSTEDRHTRNATEVAIQDQNLLGKCIFREIANTLREWVPIVCAHGGEVSDDQKDVAEGFVVWLDALAKSLTTTSFSDSTFERVMGRGGHWNPVAKAHGQYKVEYLLRCLLAMFDNMHFEGSRGEGKGLGAPMERLTTKIVQTLPPNIRQTILDMISDAPMPSRSTLCNARLAFDVAYMLLNRERFQALVLEDSVIFPIIDKSPQGGRRSMRSSNVVFIVCQCYMSPRSATPFM
jgi:hypothetical protein